MSPSQPGTLKIIDLRQSPGSSVELTESEQSQLKLDLQQAEIERVQAAMVATKASQPQALLNSGFTMPLVGLGTWKSSPGEVQSAVLSALKAGYRHIDCAAIYGNEHEVGEALKSAFTEGIVTRQDVFITSKLWNTEHAPERVEPALRKTLSDLQLEYLDLYLIHWPSSLPGPTIRPPYIDTWRVMEDMVDKGLIKSIGVSNFSSVKIHDLMSQARIRPAVNQVEAHPYWRNDKLLAWCSAHGIHVTAYSPLGSPDSASIMKRDANAPTPMKDPVVVEVAQKLGKSPAQVLIRWAVQRGTSVLPKSVNPERIASNFDVFSWSIPDDLMAQLNSLSQARMVDGSFMLHKDGPFKTVAEFWDNDS